MPTKRIALLSPGSCKGFVTSRVGNALPPGYVSGLYDFRLGDGSLRVRNASILINAATPGPYRGSFECLMGGVPTLFLACLVSGSVRVYRSLDEGATFAEITSSATRMADAGPVFFAVVAQDSTDYVVFQNGTDAPRYYDGTTVRAVPTLNPSNLTATATADLGPGTTFAGATVANMLASDFEGVVKPYGTGFYLELHADPRIDGPGEYVTVTLADSIPVPTDASKHQIVAVLDAGIYGQDATTTDERWRAIQIEGYDGTGWTTIYNPASTALIAEKGEGTYYLAAFPALPWQGKTITQLRYSFPNAYGKDADPDAYIRVYAVKLSGLQTGGTAYAVAYGEPGTTLATDGPTRSGGRIVTTVTPANYGGAPIPVSGYVGYVYTVRVSSTTPGVQVPVYVYRDDVGADGYFYLAKFLGQGSYADPGTGSVDYSLPLPDANALGIPRGTQMASVNGRLFVCAGNRLYYSQSERPFVFSLLVLFSDDGNPIATSAGSFSKAGESFQAVIGVGSVLTGAETLGTPQSGAVSVYAMTDRTTYILSGWDAASLNKTTPVCVGTKSPLSVSRGTDGGFAMLDSDRQVRRVRGTDSSAISKDLVDVELSLITSDRLRWVSGATISDRYFLAYPFETGATNSRILVWNEGIGWESIDRPAQAAQGLLAILSAAMGRKRLLRFSDAGLWEHDAPGVAVESDGSRVTATVFFPEIQEGFASVEAGAGFLLCTPDASGTFTLTVTAFSGDRLGANVYAPVSLAPGLPNEYRVAKRTEGGKGAKALSYQPSLSVTAQGSTRLFRFEMDTIPGSNDLATQ